MTRLKTILGAVAVAFIVVGGAGQAFAGDIADKQGFCKGANGSCNGASECGNDKGLPTGFEKKC
jgi:hypothetical protein